MVMSPCLAIWQDCGSLTSEPKRKAGYERGSKLLQNMIGGCGPLMTTHLIVQMAGILPYWPVITVP